MADEKLNPILWEQRVDDGMLAIINNETQGRVEACFEPDMANENTIIVDIQEEALQTLLDEEGDQWDIGLDLMRRYLQGWHAGRLSQHGGAKHLKVVMEKNILLAGNTHFDMTWNDGECWWEIRDGDNHFANADTSVDAERKAQYRLVNPNYSQFALNGWETCDIIVGDDVVAGWMRDLPEGIMYITPMSGVFDYSYTDLEGNDHKLESRRTLEEAKEGADDYYARKFG